MIRIAQLSCGTEYSGVQKEIEKAVNNGMMDADQAGALLTKLQK